MTTDSCYIESKRADGEWVRFTVRPLPNRQAAEDRVREILQLLTPVAKDHLRIVSAVMVSPMASRTVSFPEGRS